MFGTTVYRDLWGHQFSLLSLSPVRTLCLHFFCDTNGDIDILVDATVDGPLQPSSYTKHRTPHLEHWQYKVGRTPTRGSPDTGLYLSDPFRRRVRNLETGPQRAPTPSTLPTRPVGEKRPKWPLSEGMGSRLTDISPPNEWRLVWTRDFRLETEKDEILESKPLPKPRGSHRVFEPTTTCPIFRCLLDGNHRHWTRPRWGTRTHYLCFSVGSGRTTIPFFLSTIGTWSMTVCLKEEVRRRLNTLRIDKMSMFLTSSLSRLPDRFPWVKSSLGDLKLGIQTTWDFKYYKTKQNNKKKKKKGEVVRNIDVSRHPSSTSTLLMVLSGGTWV